MIAAASPLFGQSARWEYRSVTAGGDEKYAPQVAIDRAGTLHLVWLSKDPAGSGVQFFYSNDITGSFHAPMQITDTGSVVDTPLSNLLAGIFHVDSRGTAHMAFTAQVPGGTYGAGVFYTSNGGALSTPTSDFRTPRRLLDSNILQYDIAVDSLGNLHLVWLDSRDASLNRFYYWRSTAPAEKRLIATRSCSPGADGCRTGNLELESGPNGLVLAFRADSGSVYLLRQTGSVFLPAEKVAGVLPYDAASTAAGKADLRLRMALDAAGTIHLLYPHFDAVSRYRIMHLSGIGGQFTSMALNGTAFDTSAADFDLAWNGTDRIAAVWTVHPTVEQAGLPRIGFAEFSIGSNRWSFEGDLNALLRGDATVWKDGVRIAALGDRIAIVGVNRTGTSAGRQIGMILRTVPVPEIRYIHPDVAAPGMSVTIEAVAAARNRGGFGPDGFRKDTVRMEVVDLEDTSRVVFGPAVVSWDGRLVSTMAFVHPDAAPGPVTVRINVNGRFSNTQTFEIVAPQKMGVLEGGGVIGGRSRRGVIVVDSLILRSGIYTIDTSDSDPAMPGNQGFLPVTILSRGPVQIASGAVLSVSAQHDPANRIFGSAGPGGGGGGIGGGLAGGSGYTPGGGGTIAGSLNGAPGGSVLPSGPGGGGTGHPFGTAGAFGRVSPVTPISPNKGGYGGAAGGVQSLEGSGITYGGGGGGNGLAGLGAGSVDNGGPSVGNPQLVPLAGGSGGGGGGYASGGSASGGGGGGAIAIFSDAGIEIRGDLLADGASGFNNNVGNTSGGGAGSGGSILLGARDTVRIAGAGKLRAAGGIEGKKSSASGSNDGGKGGAGRIRIDGRTSRTLNASPIPASSGPVITLRPGMMARSGETISGVAARSVSQTSPTLLLLYTRPKGGTWGYDTPYMPAVGEDGSWSVQLNSSADAEEVYVVAMQKVYSPIHEEFQQSPGWIFSSVGGTILGRPEMEPIPDTIAFDCIDYYLCQQRELSIGNSSSLAHLSIDDIRVVGDDSSAFTPSVSSIRVGPHERQSITVNFCPNDTGTFEAELLLYSNVMPASQSVRRIRLLGCAVSGKAVLREESLDFGAICPEECRDTVVRLYNRGEGRLVVDAITGQTDAVQVTLRSDVTLPFTLAPGASIDLPMRLCLTQVSRTGVAVRISARSVYPLPLLLVKGTNRGPEYSIPTGRNFGLLLMDIMPACSTMTVPVRNTSQVLPLQFRLKELVGDPQFTVTPAVIDTILPPGGLIVLTVKFCPDTEREYNGTLKVVFGGGSCEVDTDVKLYGRGEFPQPKFVIRNPLPDPADGIRRFHFQKTSINPGGPVATQFIRVMNEGTAAGQLSNPVVTGDVADFVIGAMETSLDKQEWSYLSVDFKPKTTGVKHAWIYFADRDGGWRDSVAVEGEGAKPGIQIQQAGIDFDTLRRGSSVTGYVSFYNDGQIADRLRGLAPVRAPFMQTRITVIRKGQPETESSLSVVIDPSITEVRIYYKFEPQQVGRFDTTVQVTYGDDEHATFYLRGVAVLEQIASAPDEINFGCLQLGDSTSATFTLSNPGSYPLTITGINISGGDFKLLGPEIPPVDIIKPGETRTYTVGFTARAPYANGVVVISSSDPDRRKFSVYLSGTVCDSALATIALTIPDMIETVGDHFELPIHARMNITFTDTMSYRLVISYPYDMLMPMLPDEGPPRVIDGTISGTIRMEEVAGKPGELTIDGGILPGKDTGIVVKIPFKVLLGSHYRDSIRFKLTDIPMVGLVRRKGGAFQALDCDTSNGGVILKGLYTLAQNRPNPFNPATVIPYSIARQDRVRLNLYDATGKLVKVLLDEVQPPGEYRYSLHIADLPSGVYICEMISGPFRKAVRMVLME